MNPLHDNLKLDKAVAAYHRAMFEKGERERERERERGKGKGKKREKKEQKKWKISSKMIQGASMGWKPKGNPCKS